MKRRDLFRLFTAGLFAAQLPAPAAAPVAPPISGRFMLADCAGLVQPGDIVGLSADGRFERCASHAARVVGFVLSISDGRALVQLANRYELRFAEALN